MELAVIATMAKLRVAVRCRANCAGAPYHIRMNKNLAAGFQLQRRRHDRRRRADGWT